MNEQDTKNQIERLKKQLSSLKKWDETRRISCVKKFSGLFLRRSEDYCFKLIEPVWSSGEDHFDWKVLLIDSYKDNVSICFSIERVSNDTLIEGRDRMTEEKFEEKASDALASLGLNVFFKNEEFKQHE